MQTPKSNLVKTKDIKTTLQKYASLHRTTVEKLDFSLKGVKTYIKTREDSDFELFNEDVEEVYKDEKKIINDHLQFKQIYAIAIKKDKPKTIKLNYSIDFGEYSANPIMIIEPDSVIPYKTNKAQNIFALLVQEINKIKAKNKIIINIFDREMVNSLKKFTRYLYAGRFTRRVKIPLFKGVEPEFSKNSGLVLHFKKKKTTKEFIEVDEGELLAEFTKPLFGANGFSAFGTVIDSDAGINAGDFKQHVDTNTILIKEEEDHKLYFSKLKGFVVLTDEKFMVSNKIRMSSISRLNNKLAQEDEDNNLEVIVAQNDTNQDSVGAGTELVSETVHITGHVGAKSTIEAEILQIDGATHKDSTQFAKNATINRHKGTLRCNKAEINLLEGGVVHATTANVKSSLGGEIYAQDVTIGLAKNHLKVFATHSITVDLVTGEDNYFKINYKDIPIFVNKIKYLEKDLEDLKYQLEEAQRHDISQVKDLEEKIIDFKHEKNKITTSALKAKITITQPLRGQNRIIFTLDNGDEIMYKTSPKRYDPFYLEVKDETVILHPVNKTIPLK